MHCACAEVDLAVVITMGLAVDLVAAVMAGLVLKGVLVMTVHDVAVEEDVAAEVMSTVSFISYCVPVSCIFILIFLSE